MGKRSGEAFVELLSRDDLYAALSRHKQHIGDRYIDGEFITLTYNILFIVMVMGR